MDIVGVFDSWAQLEGCLENCIEGERQLSGFPWQHSN